jgi:Ser/Thr protein kinase RdoA (MazF antagonist)
LHPGPRVRPLSPAAAFVLDHLKMNSERYFGQVAALQPLREVIGPASRVVRARLQLPGRDVIVYVKFYKQNASPEERRRFEKYIRTEFNRTTLARRVATAAAGVPTPLACIPEQLALVTQEAAGTTLARLLRQMCVVRTPATGRATLRALHRVGRWLRQFQDGVPTLGLDAANLRTYLDVRLTRLVAQQRRTFTPADRQAVLDFHDRHAARLTADDLRVVPIHADLCPTNILVRSDGITVLDLASSSDGARYCDVAHLYMHLAFAGRRFHLGHTLTDHMQRVLLDGFERGLRADAPLFRLLLLQHLACYLMWISTHPRYDRSTIGEWRFGRAITRCWSMVGIR